MPNDAREAARGVARILLDALGDELLAVYLHGSAVLGGFQWDRSDLDILALSREALSDQQFRQVVPALASVTYPANGLELSLLTAGEASQPEFPAPRFQLHETTDGWDRAGKVVDGRGRDGDPDLVLHLAVCRELGAAIVGPPPRDVLTPVPAETILSAMLHEIDWAREQAPLEYLVLTSARAWLFVETGRLGSKVEAGEWAAERYTEPNVIEAALARQRGIHAAVAIDEAGRFAGHIQSIAGAR